MIARALQLFSAPEPSTDVLAEQTRLLHAQVPQSVLGGMGVGAFLLFLAYGSFDNWMLILWVALYLLICTLRLWFFFSVKEDLADDEMVIRWEGVMHTVLALTGLFWGATAGVLVWQMDIIFDAVVVALMGGLSAGAVTAVGSIYRCYLYYAIPMLLPLIVALALGETTLHLGLAIMVILYLMANLSFARKISQSIIETINTRIENDQLILKMAEQQQVLEKQNREIQASMKIAEEANRAKSVFLASASHDLAQPLHSMRLFLLALKSETDPVLRADLIEKATQCSDRLSELFMALLDISKLDAGIVTVNPSVFDIADMLDLLSAEFEGLQNESGVRFETELVSALVDTDQTILQRVLRNLLHNAFKYTSRGHVVLTAKLVGENVVVSVSDSGPGIAAEEIDHIFEEFYQIGNPERDRSRGLGLGLAIVKRLSQLADYQVQVESEPGKGATFSLTLPVSRTQPGSVRQPGAENVASETGQRLVVFIDDEDDTRQGMALILGGLGFSTVIAEDYDDALAQVLESEQTPDLIISDYRLREHHTGVEAILRLREEFNADIPALIVTGDTSPDSLKEIGDHEIDVIHKMSSQQVFETKIQEALYRELQEAAPVTTSV